MRRPDHGLVSGPLALTTFLIAVITTFHLILTQTQQNDGTQYLDSPNRIWFADKIASGSRRASRQDPLPQTSCQLLYDPTLPPNFTDTYAPVDAYKFDFCGEAKLNWWQLEQRAYRCPFTYRVAEQSSSDQSRAQSRIVDGAPANQGQFPFHVKLKIHSDTKTIRCGGTLIHDDLVLTVSQCLTDTTNRIVATLGTNDVNPIEGIGIQREAAKWCYFNSEGWSQGLDLAIVRLKEPVKYEKNKVWPACMFVTGGWKPRSPTMCSVIGMGYMHDENASNYLMTLPVQRRCFDYQNYPRDQYAHCYVADEIGTPCAGDNGSPVVCYDKCINNRTRAFAVGAVSHFLLGHDCRTGQELTTFRVSEYHEAVYGLTCAVRSKDTQGEYLLGNNGICDYPRGR